MDSIFFTLSKFTWALLSPSNLIIFALGLGTVFLLFKHHSLAKWFLVPTAILSLTVMLYPVGDYLIEPLETRFHQPEKTLPNVDGIIVLGGGEDYIASLSWDTPEINAGGDRYIGAAYLAQKHPEIPVFLTGGSGSLTLRGIHSDGSIPELLLKRMGVANDRMIIEPESRNTYENFKYTKPLLPKQDGTYLLVTSAFHMPRSVGIARQQGINVIAYPVDYRSSTEQYRFIEFKFLKHIDVLEIAWKEWIGLTVYYFTNKTNEWLPEQ